MLKIDRAIARKPRDAAAVLFGLTFADDIHYKFKSSQASKARLQSSKHTGAKQNLLKNGHSSSSKVMCFGVRDTAVFLRRATPPLFHLNACFWNRVRSRSIMDVCNFLLVVNSNLGHILPRFRDIAGFLLTIATPPPFHPNFGSVLLGLDLWSCGSEERIPQANYSCN